MFYDLPPYFSTEKSMKKIIFILFCSLLLSSCILHRQNIQQGNIITQEQIAQLKVGMTEEQVRYVMGTPVLQNTFEPNRWDYVYTLHANNKTIEKHVTLFFAKGIVRDIQTTL